MSHPDTSSRRLTYATAAQLEDPRGLRHPAAVAPARAISPSAPGRSLTTAGLQITTKLSGDEWDQAITEFADGYYEQTEKLQGAHWGDSRVRRIAIAIDGKTVAMALAIIFRLPFVNRGLALVKYGPLWRRKGEPANREMLALALDVLVDQLVVRERLSLSVMPFPDPRFAGICGEELRQRNFKHRPLPHAERFLVNATLAPDRQLASLDQKWRRNLRSAFKKGLSIGPEEAGASLTDFGRLCASMEKRKSYANPLWPLFEKALSNQHTAAISPVLVYARENGVPVAGAVIIQLGDTAHYAIGATSDRGVQINAGYALHWWITDWLRGRQCHWYDLGGALPQSGIRQFKKGLIGKEGVIEASPGEFTLAPDVLGRLAAGLLLGIRRTRLIVRAQVLACQEFIRSHRQGKHR